MKGWWWGAVTYQANGPTIYHRRALRMRMPEKTRRRWMQLSPGYVLKVDVDVRRCLSLKRLVGILERANRHLIGVIQERSPSGRGWHRWVRVYPPPATAVETVALQLLCGSDPAREAYNVNRARAVDEGKVSEFFRKRWNVFYAREGDK